ncbi:MAG: prolyl oligopeptidase family serine peptidase [Phycisphaerae bacterium]|nr:prolyl oligopeptidase family serine peptidase [Phycisphaerae bacterium]
MLLGCSNLKPLPPRAAKIPHTTTIHGQTRVDDYFWLREKQNPAVIAYLRAENDYTERVLAPLKPLQEQLYREFLSRLQEDDAEAPYRDGAYLYYSRTEKGKDYRIYCRRSSPDAPEQIILDVNELARGHDYLSVPFRAVSDDGNLLAFGVSYSAFREHRLYVKDLRSGAMVRLGGDMDVSSIAWAADNRTLFFCVEDESKRPYRVYRQSLDGAEPVLVYEEADRAFNTVVGRTRSGRFIVIASGSANTADAHFIPADSPTTAPRRLAARVDGQEYYVDDTGPDGQWVLRVNDTGRNFRLVTAPVGDSERLQWRQLVPHRDDVMLEDHLCFRRHIVLAERTGGLPRLTVLERDSGQTHSLAMPEAVYNLFTDHNEVFDTTVVRFVYESPITPSSTFEYDMQTRTSRLIRRLPVPNYDPDRYEVLQQFATADDGTRVPISIVRRKDLGQGPHPLWLTAYGAYGLPEIPDFSATRFSLLDRGVIFAIAHVRGGGEMGKLWHEQGLLMQKSNTFTDFIS